MASINEISLPHGTIPTQMFGNVNLQNAIMYVNENFAEVKDGVNDAVAAANDALDAKADAEHDHDEDYAALSHTHAQSEITGLSSALDGKADLNHSHSQYLSSLPTHYHDTASVQGLDNLLQAKAEKVHTHTIADVENLTTELGVKASTSYVDQQVSSVSTSIKTIADNEIESYAADKGDTTTEGKTPKNVEIAPENETTAQKNARVGTDTDYARADHKHVFATETDTSQLSSLKVDGNGTDGAADFGTSTKVPRLDHSHPLNFPDDKPVTAMAQDGRGEGGTALFGATNYYADLGHSHPLNVATSGTPSDVVKSTETASLGNAETYAKTDHVHKMPALSATDILYGSSTVGAKLDNHESRIDALEDAPAPSYPVTSVNGQTGDVELDADDVGALDSNDIGDTVQAHSDKLDSLNTALDSNGKVPLTQLTGYISGHTGTCYVTIDNEGNLGHSKNAAYNLLNDAAFSGGGERGAHKLITDLDVSNGIEADSSTHNISVKEGDGISVTSDGVSVKVDSGKGITVSSDGIALTALTASKWMKTDASGLPSTTNETPIVASTSSTGVVYNAAGAISYKTIGSAQGNVAAGDHTHAYGDASLTGFGTAAEKDVGFFAVKATETTASTALTNAATAQSTAEAAQTTANSKIDKSTADGYYQPKSSVLTAVAGGGLYDTTNGAHEVTSGAHYIAVTSQRERILGVAANSHLISARDAIGTDMVSYDGTNTLDDIIDTNGNVDASHVSFSSASGSKVVETDSSGALVESSSDYAKFSSSPSGSKWVKTSGTDGTLAEVATEDEPIAPPESSTANDRVATCKANGTAVTWEDALTHTMDANPVNNELYPSDAEDPYPSDLGFTNWEAGNANNKGLKLSAYVMLSEYDGSRLMMPIVISITKDGIVSSVKKSTSSKCLTVSF